MKPWDFETIRRATDSKWLQRGSRAFNGAICTDSRKAKEGDLFIAIRGENHDAHDFLPQVIAAKVGGVLVSNDMPADIVAAAVANGVTILQTDDTISGLNRLAAAYRREIRATVIAVGGSNGKTTTKTIIHNVLSQKLTGHASPKSFNNNIGMPLTLLEVEPHHDYVVLEIGTNAPGEIAALGAVARPDIALITSIGLEHLEKLTDLDGVAREEAAIATFIQPGGVLMLPAALPELSNALRLSSVQRITVGPPDSGADMYAARVGETLEGCTFWANDQTKFRLPLLGQHNIGNALFAIAVARRMAVSDDQIQFGFDAVKPASGRLEIMRTGGPFVLNDAYNANPTSMAASLKTFCTLPLPPRCHEERPDVAPPFQTVSPVRRVAILGDMLELGAAGPAAHRDVGTQIAAANIGLFIAVGPAMRAAADIAASAGIAVHRFDNAQAAGAALPDLLQPGDAILLKGSHSMALESLLDTIAALPQYPH
jgi:UDP-N-acetylmuramoyl-tripeptide--D-alanyl-D-alanine ligase